MDRVTVISGDWLDAEETMRTLGIAKRTLQTWAQRGFLRHQRKAASKKGKGRAERVFNREDVERLQREGRQRDPKPPSAAVATQLKPKPAPQPKVLAATAAPSLAAPSLFLTLEQASLYAGLTVGFLRKLIGEQRLFALRGGERGTWVISRASLESFAGRRRFR